jgi:hypothetical protein
MRFKTGIDNVAYDEDKAMGDAHESAKSDAAQPAPSTEGVSLSCDVDVDLDGRLRGS